MSVILKNISVTYLSSVKLEVLIHKPVQEKVCKNSARNEKVHTEQQPRLLAVAVAHTFSAITV